MLPDARAGVDTASPAPTPLETLQRRRALELPYPAGVTVVLVRAPAGATPITVTLTRGPKEAREERGPEVAAEGVGLYTLRLDPVGASDSAPVLRLRRPASLLPTGVTRVTIDALVPDGAGKPPRRVSSNVELPVSGKPVELKWTGAGFSPG